MGEQSSPSPGNPSFSPGLALWVTACPTPMPREQVALSRVTLCHQGKLGTLRGLRVPMSGAHQPSAQVSQEEPAGQVPWPGSGCPRSLDLAGLRVKIRHVSSFVQRKLCSQGLRGPFCGSQFCFM